MIQYLAKENTIGSGFGSLVFLIISQTKEFSSAVSTRYLCTHSVPTTKYTWLITEAQCFLEEIFINQSSGYAGVSREITSIMKIRSVE